MDIFDKFELLSLYERVFVFLCLMGLAFALSMLLVVIYISVDDYIQDKKRHKSLVNKGEMEDERI